MVARYLDLSWEHSSLKKSRDSLGGIDFQVDKVDLDVRGKGSGQIRFNVDRAMLQQLRNSAGFKPVIINMQPADLPLFLGIKKGLSKEPVLAANSI